MSVTRTKRLKLYSESDTELIDQFYLNWPIIDAAAGGILTTGDATPPDANLYDGALVIDETSGKQWIAKQNPETLTFSKEYMIYPWNIQASNPNVNVGHAAGTAAAYQVTTFQSGINATAGDIVSGHIVVPIDGIYEISMNVKWPANATGARSSYININDGAESYTFSEDLRAANGDLTTNSSTMFKKLAAGDKINAMVWQNSGGTLNAVAMYWNVTMVSPL